MGALFGRRERRTTPAFPEPPVPATYGGGYGANVTANPSQPNTALTIPAVWACVGLLANAVSMLPLETFNRDTSGVPARATDPSVVLNPMPRMTQSEWLHQVMVSLLLRGNAFARIVRDGADVTQLLVLNPDLMTVDTSTDPARPGVRFLYGPNRDEIPVDQLWHLRGLTLPGYAVGLSPISYAAATLGVDLGARKFADDYFAAGGLPKAVLTSDQSIDATQARTMKERVMQATRSREPLVLGQGLSYSKMSVNPEESQFLATQKANVDQIARFFNVPATMIGGSAGSGMTYASVEQQSINFLTYSVAHWLKRIEDAVSSVLPRREYVKFNVEELLRTDAETRAKTMVQLIAGKVLTPTEVRARYELPPMSDAQKDEVNLVPLTITPLGSAKALPGMAEPGGPPAAIPKQDVAGQGEQNSLPPLRAVGT